MYTSDNATAAAKARQCLGVQLLDEEGNNASSSTASVFTVAKDITGNPYALLNPSRVIITADGVVLWCSLYSTNVTQRNVTIGVSVGANVTWLAGVFNVSSPGPPASLSMAQSPNQSSTPLVPGQPPPAMSLVISDAGGNALANITKSFVIRIRVQLRQGVSASRSLLQTLTPPCQSIIYVTVAAGRSGLVSASPPLLCTAGDNDILYDIGDVIGDAFVPTFEFELKTTVTVIPGPFETFSLKLASQLQSKSYSLVQDLEILFLDRGLNTVSGRARMLLQPSNASVRVYPSAYFDVVSNVSAPSLAKLPPFYVSISDWNANPATSDTLIHISVVGSINKSSSSDIALSVSPTCPAGSRLRFPYGNNSLDGVYDALLALRNVTCTPCTRPEYDSWLLDSPNCVTLQYTSAPALVHSGRTLAIIEVTALTDEGSVAVHASSWSVLVMLRRPGSSVTAVNCSVVLQQGRSIATTVVPAYTDRPDSNYAWFLQLFPYNTSRSPVLNISLAQAVTVLDFSPAALQIAPSTLPYAGLVSITITGMFPLGFSARAFFVGGVMPAVRNDSCVFTSSQPYGAKRFTLAANRSTSTNSTVSLVCGPLLLGDSGPPFTVWMASMMLSDGR
jgi:hypothetical protein